MTQFRHDLSPPTEDFLLTSSAGHGGPVLDQHPLSSLHHGSLLHVDRTGRHRTQNQVKTSKSKFLSGFFLASCCCNDVKFFPWKSTIQNQSVWSIHWSFHGWITAKSPSLAPGVQLSQACKNAAAMNGEQSRLQVAPILAQRVSSYSANDKMESWIAAQCSTGGYQSCSVCILTERGLWFKPY